jgi:hypothetical protein
MAEEELQITSKDLLPIIQAMLAELPNARNYRVGYEQRLYERWKKALDLTEVTFTFGQEIAAKFNQQVRPYASKQQDVVFDVLTRLHARACQTSSAILSLLKSGHADDALARARTLHELHVTAKFINLHGRDLAVRYRMYEAVESLKAAKEYEQHCSTSDLEPLDPETIPELEKLVERYRARFGETFARAVTRGFYGWASESLEKRSPTFEDIEAAADLAFMRPYYRMASYPIHANAKSLTVSLGKVGSRELLLAGASNAGLADAGSYALSSFYQCTALVLRYPAYSNEPDLKDLAEDVFLADKVLEELVSEARQAFLESHQQLVDDELRIQAEELDEDEEQDLALLESNKE